MKKNIFLTNEKCKVNCENVTGELVFGLWEKQQQQQNMLFNKKQWIDSIDQSIKQISISIKISSDINGK